MKLLPTTRELELPLTWKKIILAVVDSSLRCFDMVENSNPNKIILSYMSDGDENNMIDYKACSH
jgi:hypothetical protein